MSLSLGPAKPKAIIKLFAIDELCIQRFKSMTHSNSSGAMKCGKENSKETLIIPVLLMSDMNPFTFMLTWR